MKPYDITQIFRQMEIDLIASMQRNLARHEAEEAREGFEWEQWQRRKLQALAAYRKQNRSVVAGYSPKVDRAIKAMLRGSFEDGALQVDSTIRRLWNQVKHLFSRGELTVPITHVDDSDESFFRINQHRVNALIDAVTSDLRQGRAAMLRQMDDVYRQTIFKSGVYLNSGALSLGQAIDMATRDFLDKGIDCITYKNGRQVNIATYAEMALRTASQRAVFAGEGARREEWGIHTVLVSAHNNCSDLCLPWQGKPYIDDVYSGGKASDYPGLTLLSKAMASGLFHPHCRHNMSTYFPGISALPDPVDESSARANYKAEQRQRYMERQIRRYKRREIGSVDPANQAAAAAKVQEWQGVLRKHLAEHDQLRRMRSRERVLPGERPEAVQNIKSDTKQFERYQRILGERGPGSIEDFQRMKYTNLEGWKQLKGDYRKLSAYEQVIKLEPQITRDLQSISETTGMDLVGLDFRLKSRESYLRKVNSDSKNSRDMAIINDTLANTNDVIRYTYQAEGDSLVERYETAVKSMTEKGYTRHKLKNTWGDKRNPYRGVNAIFVSPDGQKFELQFHTPESFALKNGRMHEIYEEYRLDSTSPERRAELTKEMFTLSADLKPPKDIDKIK
ncbi:phage minor capsid protein [Paenibacillus sp. NFR01]|uniref:phage minor capsid protein n=1 Tax=Paenibacillus sp. NFR01 TaxID=1566279 RepID=UPI0008BDA526|nr:phage minor capsid protein [Paenibacillus sp. NFR01]SEU32380.1 Phage minor capsid protein 2 [Paenibacillus sp. NFR01]